MPNWKKVVVSGSSAELTGLTLTGLSTQGSENTALMINGSNVVGTRELGSLAFSSATYDNYDKWVLADDGDVTTLNVTSGLNLSIVGGSNVTSVLSGTGGNRTLTISATDTNTTYSAGDLLDLSGTTFNVDLSELTTSTSNGDGDYFVVVDDANAQKKLTKANIALSGFNNDLGWTSNTGDITSVISGNGLTGGGTTGAVTLNVGAGTGIDVAANSISVDVSDFMSSGANNRVLTATGTDAMQAEANLTFETDTLTVGQPTNSNKGKIVLKTNTDGSSPNGSVTIQPGNTKSDFTLTLPSANGTVALTSDIDTYSAGSGITLTGTTFSVSAGGGLTQTAGGLSHTDTSTQASVNNALGNVIQDVTLDTYGHVTSLGSVDLDSRFLGISAKASDSDKLDNLNSTQFLRSDVATVFNEAAIDIDFRVESVGNANMLFVDGGTNRVGIGTNSPTYELDVNGDIGVNQYLRHNGDANTYINFEADEITLQVGGEELINITGDSGGTVKLGDGGDVDINLNDNLLVRGSDGNVGIGTISPESELQVNGEISGSSIRGTYKSSDGTSGINIASATRYVDDPINNVTWYFTIKDGIWTNITTL